jgi:hypothetical protein
VIVKMQKMCQLISVVAFCRSGVTGDKKRMIRLVLGLTFCLPSSLFTGSRGLNRRILQSEEGLWRRLSDLL